MERVTGIGGVFQRAGEPASLRAWYAEHLGIDLSDRGTGPFDWTPGGFGWALDPEGTRFELWEPPPGG
jgi:hypothetical protein